MSMDNFSGRRIGMFELRQLLGEGGMGAVYRAVDLQLNRSVALKLLHPHIARQDQFRQRFIQEAQAIAMLDHPNIVRVYTFSSSDDFMYLVMELVATGSLRKYLKDQYAKGKIIPVPEALLLVRQVASALHYAHEQKMVHRDVKPENILLKLSSDSGTGEMIFNALLTDFGLVKLSEGSYQTQGHVAMGTMPYMAPEQFRGHVDPRMDIYALGVVLYELVVGKLPFLPQNMAEAAEMHLNQEPPLPSTVRPGLTPRLEQVILRALQKNPANRFQSGLDMLRAIREVETGEAEQLTALQSIPNKQVSLESLTTYLVSQPGMPIGKNVPIPEAPPALKKDRIVVAREGLQPEPYDLTKPVTLIGRGEDVDIQLMTNAVSRHHAKVDRHAHGGYTLTDLGSRNKTYVDGVPLLPNLPEPWLPTQIIAIGEFRLSLQRATEDRTGPMPSVEAPAPPIPRVSTPPPQIDTRFTEDPVDVTLAPPATVMEAGGRAEVTITLHNTSRIVQHFHVKLQGLPTEWFTLPNIPAQLMPGEQTTRLAMFHPPRRPTSTAGTHPFYIRVAIDELGQEIDRAQGSLTINPYYEFGVDMYPSDVTKDRPLQYIIENRGNAPDTYTVTGRDSKAELLFEPNNIQVPVAAGQKAAVDIWVRPRTTPLMGTPQTYPMEISAQSSADGVQTKHGTRLGKPKLPRWIAGIASLLCLGLIVGGAALASLLGGNGDDDEDTAAEMTRVAVQLTLDDIRTRESILFTPSTTATLAATATATLTPLPTATTSPTFTPPPVPCGSLPNRLGADNVHCIREIGSETVSGFVAEIAMNSNGGLLLVAGRQLWVYILDGNKAISPFTELTIHGGDIWDVVISPDSQLFASTADDNRVRVWGTFEFPLLAEIDTEVRVRALDFYIDSSFLIGGGDDGNIRYWHTNLDTPGRLWDMIETGISSPIRALTFSPDGAIIIAAFENGRVISWETWNHNQWHEYPAHTGTVFTLDVSDDGSFLASGSFDGNIHISNLATGRLFRTLNVGGGVLDLDINPNGTLIISGDANGEIKLWDVSSGALLRTDPTEMRNVLGVVFHPDGSAFAFGGGVPTWRLWGK